MNRIPALAMASLLLVMAAGCGSDADKREAVAKEMGVATKEFHVILVGIKDVATANAATPKLKAQIDKMVELTKRAKALPEPTPQEEGKLMKITDTASEGARDQMQGELMRVMSIPGVAPVMMDTMKDLEKLK